MKGDEMDSVTRNFYDKTTIIKVGLLPTVDAGAVTGEYQP